MPRGRPRKVAVVETKTEVVDNGLQGKEEKAKEVNPVNVTPMPKYEPLGPGQKYFEAPTGEVLIGDATADRMWFRAGNNGKGLWINPKR